MDRVVVEREGGIAVVRFNRPEVLNALDQAMWQGLLDAFRRLGEDPTLRVCLLTGAGRGFCSGADLKETAWHGETTAQSAARIDEHHQELARLMIGLPAPIIACVNGYAMGGGVEIALAADIRIASSAARFGFPEAAIGRFITGGSSLLLQKAVGSSQAKRLLFTSEHIDAETAAALGLVDQVVEAEALLAEGMRLAEQIAANADHSVKLMKRVLDDIALEALEGALARETEALVSTYSRGEIDAAAQAFNARKR